MRARVSIDTTFETFAALNEFFPDLEVVGVVLLGTVSRDVDFGRSGTHNFSQKLSQLEVVLIASAKGVHMYALWKVVTRNKFRVVLLCFPLTFIVLVVRVGVCDTGNTSCY